MKIPFWSVKKIVLSLILLVVFSCVVPYARLGYLNLHGYCAATGKYMTDQKRVEILVQYALDEKILSGEYSDVADFLTKNPNCCHVTDGTPNDGTFPVDFMDKVVGAGVNHVSIDIPWKSLRNKNEKYVGMPGINFIVSNCGSFWNY